MRARGCQVCLIYVDFKRMTKFKRKRNFTNILINKLSVYTKMSRIPLVILFIHALMIMDLGKQWKPPLPCQRQGNAHGGAAYGCGFNHRGQGQIPQRWRSFVPGHTAPHHCPQDHCGGRCYKAKVGKPVMVLVVVAIFSYARNFFWRFDELFPACALKKMEISSRDPIHF